MTAVHAIAQRWLSRQSTIIFPQVPEDQRGLIWGSRYALFHFLYIIFPLCDGILAPPGLGPLTPDIISFVHTTVRRTHLLDLLVD